MKISSPSCPSCGPVLPQSAYPNICPMCGGPIERRDLLPITVNLKVTGVEGVKRKLLECIAELDALKAQSEARNGVHFAPIQWSEGTVVTQEQAAEIADKMLSLFPAMRDVVICDEIGEPLHPPFEGYIGDTVRMTAAKIEREPFLMYGSASGEMETGPDGATTETKYIVGVDVGEGESYTKASVCEVSHAPVEAADIPTDGEDFDVPVPDGVDPDVYADMIRRVEYMGPDGCRMAPEHSLKLVSLPYESQTVWSAVCSCGFVLAARPEWHIARSLHYLLEQHAVVDQLAAGTVIEVKAPSADCDLPTKVVVQAGGKIKQVEP